MLKPVNSGAVPAGSEVQGEGEPLPEHQQQVI